MFRLSNKKISYLFYFFTIYLLIMLSFFYYIFELIASQYAILNDHHNLIVAIIIVSAISVIGMVFVFLFIQRLFKKVKNYKNKLQRSETLLKNILHSTPDLISAKNTQLQYILANEAYVKSIDKKFSAIIGYTDIEIGCPAELVYGDKSKGIVGFEQEDKLALQGKTSHHGNCTSSDGTIIYDTHKMPLVDEADHIVGVLTIARDITERIKKLKKIKSQQQEQFSILDNMHDAVIVIDDKGIINSVNSACETTFGYSSKELLGASVKMLLSESIAKKQDDYINNFLATGKGNIIGAGRELQGKKKNGLEFPVRLSVAELPQDENSHKMLIGTCHDLTEEKIQEKKYTKIQKMHVLSKLTGGIAHDYNNMLGVMLRYSELLEQQLAEQPKLANYARQIRVAGERGATLTRKLLSFSKQHHHNKSCVDINQLISATEDMLRKTLTVAIELHCNLSANLWQVNIDPDAFDDMLLNLCINAKHAMKDNGLLILTTNNKTVSAIEANGLNVKAGDYVCLTIKDNGCGMSKATQKRVFEPLFTTKGEHGTGLGLAQVQQFLNSSKGAVKINSTEDIGTEFIIYFPKAHCDNKKLSNTQKLTQEQKQEQKQALAPNSEFLTTPLKNINPLNTTMDNEENHTFLATILIVDDEPQLAELANDILSKQGYNTWCAENGEQALKILAEHPIDLLLTDIIMPKMNGYDLVAQVEKHFPTVKVVFVSGFQSRSKSNNNSMASTYPLIDKPYQARTLLSVIEKSLKKQTAFKVKLLAWSQDISIDNNGMLDQGHKQLMNIINQCQLLEENEQFNHNLNKLIEKILACFIEHFDHEELAMEICGYPYIQNHKKVHQMMIKKILSAINTKTGRELRTWVVRYLKNWLFEHTNVQDKELLPYIQAKQVEVQQALATHFTVPNRE